MNAIRSWEADLARRLGIGGLIDFDKTTVGKTLHIPCAVGQHIVDFTVRPNLDPNGTVKEMIHKNWTIGRRRLVCPDCKRKTEQEKADHRRDQEVVRIGKMPPALAAAQAKATPEQRREWSRKGGFKLSLEKRRENGRLGGLKAAANRRAKAAVEPKPIPEQETKIVPQPEPVTATDKARAAKRETMDFLTLSFKLAPDGKSGTYSDGYSDAKIAKETGLAESAVATLREDFFGTLGEPAELVALRADLATAKKSLDALKGAMLQGAENIIAIDRRFALLCQRNGWPVA